MFSTCHLGVILLATLDGAHATLPSAIARAANATYDCRLKRIAIEGFHEQSTTSNDSDATIWLCSPPDADPNAIDGEEDIVLYGNEVDALDEADLGQVVRIDLGHPPALVSSIATLPNATRRSFGGQRMARLARFVDVPVGRNSRTRRLDTSAGGARFIDRTSMFGTRNVLNVIVGVADAGSSRATWPGTCSVNNVREVMWGKPEGSVVTLGASPWSLRSECRTSNCLFSEVDHMSHISRGAVTFDESRSDVVDLGSVGGWPTDFCNWSGIWSAISNAIKSKGFDVADYNHVVAMVPKHCSIGEGSWPGKYVIVSCKHCPPIPQPSHTVLPLSPTQMVISGAHSAIATFRARISQLAQRRFLL